MIRQQQSQEILYLFIAYPWRIHWQLDLAIGEIAKQVGHECVIILCSQLQSYTANVCELIFGMEDYEALCIGCKQLMGAHTVQFSTMPLQWSDEREHLLRMLLPAISDESLEQLLTTEVIGLHPYEVAYSTLCTRFRTGNLSDIPEWRVALYQEALMSLRIWCALDEQLGPRLSPGSTLLLFNGRFTPYRTVYEYFRAHDLSCYVHERAAQDGAYRIRKNSTVFDRAYTLSDKHVAQFHELAKGRHGDLIQSYTERRILDKLYGLNTGWISFVDSNAVVPSSQDLQKIERVTADPSEEAYSFDFCFFTSSPDEMVGPLQPLVNHLTTIYALASNQLRGSGFTTAIRHHPNCGRDHRGKSVFGYEETAEATSSVFDRCFLPSESPNIRKLILGSRVCIASTSSICIEIGFLIRKCIVHQDSLFSPLFPERFLIHRTSDYSKPVLESLLNAECMNEAEYKYFLSGVLAYLESETFAFKSLGYSGINKSTGYTAEAVYQDCLLNSLFDVIIRDSDPFELSKINFISSITEG